MGQEDEYVNFIRFHESQLVSSGVPKHLWESLFLKLKNQIFDTNDTFLLLQVDYEDGERNLDTPQWLLQVNYPEGMKQNDPKNIFLVDHAWTFRLNSVKEQLIHNGHFVDRLCYLMGIQESQTSEKIESVLKQIWKYCQFYSIGGSENVEDRLPIFYLMDELGSAICHSDNPNFRTVPFLYVPEQITYTLMFPIKDLAYKEIVTRDFAEGITDSRLRECHLLPWVKKDFTDVDFQQYEPDESYFLSGHIKETLPKNTDYLVQVPNKMKMKVFSEYSLINKFLTDDRFEIVTEESSADILWLTRHFKSYEELNETPNKFINQFPFEVVLTIKDLLAIICRRKSQDSNSFDLDTLETSPSWLPTTYNLKTELDKFISYFQSRKKRNLENYWICKPWNLARSLDTHITNNLDLIIRLSTTGPKIAQKYVVNPVLFERPELGRVKFDVRYIILLKSVDPLEAYAYNNFFLRFANKPFDLSDFDDYEKHFTVMNYENNAKLHHLPCAQFLEQWKQQYDFAWEEIQKNIFKMFKEILVKATSVPPPKGIAKSPQSRAVYAVDLILSWNKSKDNIEPKLFEINWTPDCQRACDYYPNFYNNIFSCLFLNISDLTVFTKL